MDNLDEYYINKYKFHKYCECRKRLTTHIKLKKDKPIANGIATLITAFFTGFNADLREPEYECLTCGKQS